MPLTSLLSLTDSDTAISIVPRISRELQSTRCFVKIKHCIERIKQYKIDDIIVSKALARVCLFFVLFFPTNGTPGRGTRRGLSEQSFCRTLKPKGSSTLYPFDIYTTSDQTDNRSIDGIEFTENNAYHAGAIS